jgi:Glycosyl transferase family 2
MPKEVKSQPLEYACCGKTNDKISAKRVYSSKLLDGRFQRNRSSQCVSFVITKNKPMPSDVASISIIVPVYNNAQALSECLSALISASNGESEIIVVDDASTDGTPVVASQKVYVFFGLKKTRVQEPRETTE